VELSINCIVIYKSVNLRNNKSNFNVIAVLPNKGTVIESYLFTIQDIVDYVYDVTKKYKKSQLINFSFEPVTAGTVYFFNNSSNSEKENDEMKKINLLIYLNFLNYQKVHKISFGNYLLKKSNFGRFYYRVVVIYNNSFLFLFFKNFTYKISSSKSKYNKI